MRNILLFTTLFVLTLLSGCFEDTGNYEYKEINPPKWVKDFNEISPQNIYAYAGEGEKMVMKGSAMFTWETDSLVRAGEVRYEWKIGDVVIGDQIDLEIPTDKVVEMIGLKDYCSSLGLWGTFTIIEKETEISFPARLYVWIYPTFAPNDWFILSEDGQNSMVSAIRGRKVTDQGVTKIKFDLKENVYESVNKEKLPGKPLELAMEVAKDVGPSGACVIITDQVAYEVNIQDMVRISDVKDQFLDGSPANFSVVDLREKAPQFWDQGASTFVCTKDGRIFTRIKSPNYLVGQYLTEPYYVDSKGYKVTWFGHTLFGCPVPCYDEINRRILMAFSWREDINLGGGPYDLVSIYRNKIVPLTKNTITPVSEFPEGTEMLYLSMKKHNSLVTGTSLLFTAYYNDPITGNTIAGDFTFSSQLGNSTSTVYERKVTFPVKLDASSVFLTSATGRSGSSFACADAAKYRDFYTVGNKLYYVQRAKTYYDTSVRFVEFNATFNTKITALAYAFNYYDQLWIACEDGSIYGYDINNINSPVLICEKKINGTIVSMKQIGVHTNSHDWY